MIGYRSDMEPDPAWMRAQQELDQPGSGGGCLQPGAANTNAAGIFREKCVRWGCRHDMRYIGLGRVPSIVAR